MTLWGAVVLAATICLAMKAAGYLVPARVLEEPRPARISDLLTVALLAALVAVQTLGAGQAVIVDARVPAVLVAAGLLWLRQYPRRRRGRGSGRGPAAAGRPRRLRQPHSPRA